MSDDQLTVPGHPGKAKRSGLYGPLGALAVLVAAWSGYWFYAAHRIETALNDEKEALLRAGYQVTSDPFSVGGYPFRLFIELKNLSVITPGGRGLSAPLIDAEANAYALDKWVMAAPNGLTFYRGFQPDGHGSGTLAVTGSLLRASLSGLQTPVHTVDIEAKDVTVTPSDPAHPFAFATAKAFQAHLRPTPAVADSADVMMNVVEAHGAPQSLVGNLSPDKPLSFQIESTLSHAAAFKTATTWQAAGGQASRFRAKLVQGDLGADTTTVFTQDCHNVTTAGNLNLCAASDSLTLDALSRLSGHMDIQMAGTFKPVEILGAAGLISKDNLTLAQPLLDMTLATQGAPKFGLDFRNGSAYIGPLKVSDAPTVR